MSGGQVVERFLAPRWTSVTGVVRSRLRGGRSTGMAVDPRATRGWFMLVAGGAPAAEATRESWERLTVRRDGVFRIESALERDGDPFMVRRRSVAGQATVWLPDVGSRLAQNGHEAGHGLWLLEPAALAGGWELTFGDEPVEVLGRRAVRAIGHRSPVANPWTSATRSLIGVEPGERCELMVDLDTGICLRFVNVAHDEVTAEHEFTEITIDAPVDDAVGEWATRPDDRLRTPVDDLLDQARRFGIDVDDIDPDAPDAFEDVQRRLAGGTPHPPPPQRPSLRETVAPLGPPPADRTAALDAIEAALAGLGPDDPRPRAEFIEHGDLLDADDADHGGPPSHPLIAGAVTFELVDAVFLTADIALIEFRVDIGLNNPIPFNGRAVNRDGRWLISYDTAAQLRSMAGRSVPPLDEADRDG